jgi:hypothetical protein
MVRDGALAHRLLSTFEPPRLDVMLYQEFRNSDFNWLTRFIEVVSWTLPWNKQRREGTIGVWPRIALVTPVYNSGKYIEQTILSVLAQHYPNLDYFIVDGGSTDGTVEIIRKYESQISGWISEPDNGMYDAINKGFARTTGEIMGWVSATDMFQPGGLGLAARVFGCLPDVEWITGRSTFYDEEGRTTGIEGLRSFSQTRFLVGVEQHIQQESTFWRRSLWEKAGGYVDASRRMSSDFELWVRFFRHARLYSVDALIGGFRMHGDSIGLRNLDACYAIQDEITQTELASIPQGMALKLLRVLNARVKEIPVIRYAWWRLTLVGWLWGVPPVIEFHGDQCRLRR